MENNLTSKSMPTDRPEVVVHTEDLPELGISFAMIKVEGGVFEMGSEEYGDEKPIHKVQLDTFYMGKYPVTQAQWEAVMGSNPSYFRGANRPVGQVSWDDAQDFIAALNQQTERAYRLPSEAEWEFAARGGNLSRGYPYAGSHDLNDVGWYFQNSHEEPKPVGLKFPNELGLHDMSGNVWEWCQDWYSGSYYRACHDQGLVLNPKGPNAGNSRVCRGGSWDYGPVDCRSIGRGDHDPGSRNGLLGFRLVCGPQ